MCSSEAAPAAAEVARQAGALGALVEALLQRGDVGAVPEASIQEGLTALVKLYAAKREAGAQFPPILPDGVTATAAMILTTALLQAVHVELFELGMWQAWAGR